MRKLNWMPDRQISLTLSSFYKKEMIAVVDEVEQELFSVLGPRWVNMRGQSEGLIAVHSVLCLWRTLKEPQFSELSAYH